MDKYKLTTVLLLGIIIGMACKDKINDAAGIDSAYAAVNECTLWGLGRMSDGEPVPEGWEPFAVKGYCTSDCIQLRRCLD